MNTKTVVVFGAGATKACGGPLTAEILPHAYDPIIRKDIEREGYMALLEEFLIENFHLPRSPQDRNEDDYPSLSLLLSLIDTAIDRKQPFQSTWHTDRLVNVRQSLEYAIFALLEYRLSHIKRNCYLELLKKVYSDSEPVIISLNYDIIADNAVVHLSQKNSPEGHFPVYGCEIKTPIYSRQAKYFGKLLKLHGSLNWLYCPGCHRLDIGVAKSGKGTVKVLDRLYRESPTLENRYACHGSPCDECGIFVRPILITPTHRKDYRNPHVAQVWYQAERALREAARVIFVGYSLPDDDVDVVYLFKRGLEKLSPKNITVVEYDKQQRTLKDNPVGARYRSLFGDRITWWNKGLEQYIRSLGGCSK